MNKHSSTADGAKDAKRTYTVDEISELLGIGRTAAYRLVHSGGFKVVRIGTAIRISKESFDAWLDKQT